MRRKYMELMFDNANLEVLKEYTEIYPYVGVTSNPTIVKAEGKIDFFEHFRKVRKLIGKDNSLHIQVVSQTAEEIIAEAEKIVEKIDKDVYIKIPVTEEGLKAIKTLKIQGYKITATAVYTKIQGLLAIAAGVDYLAPYCNRIEVRGESSAELITTLRNEIDFMGADTKILAASFHTGNQVIRAVTAGADAVTIQPKLLREIVTADYINEAVETFANDWQMSQNCKNILDCE